MAYGSIEGKFSFEERDQKDAWRRKMMLAVVFSGLLVLGCALAHLATRIEEQEETGVSMMSVDAMNANLARKIVRDEAQLASDVKKQQELLQYGNFRRSKTMLTSYADGCSCSCPAGGCDEEKHQGPVCKCPHEAEHSLPDPFAPFNMDHTAKANGGKTTTQKMFSTNYFGNRRLRRQQMWVGSPQKMLPPDGDYPGGSTGIPEDGYIAYETGYMNDGPFHGELAPMQEAGIASKQTTPQQLRVVIPSYPSYGNQASNRAVPRRQQMWVGSPQKMLPPDGDYPGGATGIPEDGYIAYETGYMDDGPFHGELAPMQEAGIASKQPVPQQLRAQMRYIRPSYPPFVRPNDARRSATGASAAPRRQQMWVGSPQKMLPPDGDYPGGATGIPEDGYIAYETGYMDNGPFHGELAPLQEAGIASKGGPQQLTSRASLNQLRSLSAARRAAASRRKPAPAVRAARLVDGDGDERVPASAIDKSYFVGSPTQGASIRALENLV